MKKVLILFVMVIFALNVACLSGGKLPSICDDLEGPSLLCDLAKDQGIRPEDIGNALIIANAIALGQGLYTKADAVVVMNHLILVLEDPISGVLFISELDDIEDAYPGLLQVATSYIGVFSQRVEPMYENDRAMIQRFLQTQVKLLMPKPSLPNTTNPI